MIRLYGIGKGNGSWARVTHGIRRALEELGLLAGFFDVSKMESSYDDDGDAILPGHEAPVALCVGPPLSTSVMIARGNHEERLLMVATNSTWLPHSIMEHAAKMVTGFVGTSKWASSVIENYAYGRPVITFPHGVDTRFCPLDDDAQLDERFGFRVLHLASTHMQRKGTRELIFAWAQALPHLRDGARLTLICDGPSGYFMSAIEEATDGASERMATYELRQRGGYTIEEMSALYQRHHVLCQPSRAEGFGLTVLESLACGVPVIATACTGHAEYLNDGSPGAVVVPHGPHDEVDDGPGATAPTVSPTDIADALLHMNHNWPKYKEQAMKGSIVIRSHWTWKACTARFLAEHHEQLGLEL